MSEATNQLLDDAHKALQWLLNNIRQDAPQLSGKAMGNAERVITAIDAALSQPAPSPQPAVPVVSDDILIEREYERVMGQHLRPQDRAGVLKVCRAILALRPAVEPMTPLTDSEMEKGREQIFSTNNPYCPCDRKTFRKVAQWVEWHHKIGITAKAEGGA